MKIFEEITESILQVKHVPHEGICEILKGRQPRDGEILPHRQEVEYLSFYHNISEHGIEKHVKVFLTKEAINLMFRKIEQVENEVVDRPISIIKF